MENKNYTDDQKTIIEGYNNQLRHWDVKKQIIQQMLKDMDEQYHQAHIQWDGIWLERQSYINEIEEKKNESLEAAKNCGCKDCCQVIEEVDNKEKNDPMDDFNYVGSKDHY